MCYDVSRRQTFLSVRSWLEALLAQEPHAAVVLCACKADVEPHERQVPAAEGATLARVLGVPFFETSAKTGLHVREAFHALAEEVVEKHEGSVSKAHGASPAGAGLVDRLNTLDSTPLEPLRVIDDSASGKHTSRCAC